MYGVVSTPRPQIPVPNPCSVDARAGSRYIHLRRGLVVDISALTKYDPYKVRNFSLKASSDRNKMRGQVVLGVYIRD